MAKAGADVYHGGLIGEDGVPFLESCADYHVNLNYLRKVSGKTGHAIIQVDKNAQNSILLYGGTNQELTEEYVDEILEHFGTGDMLLLQNEVNLLPYIIDRANEKGMDIVLNPSPYNEKIQECDLSKVKMFILNEIEGSQITGEVSEEDILRKMLELYPDSQIVLTLGEKGAVYAEKDKRYVQPSFKVDAIDTTAAGDTFTGYFLAGLLSGLPVKDILKISAKAASIAVTRNGAVESIPYKDEVFSSLLLSV